MTNHQKKTPFLKRKWVSLIGPFIVSQLIFITFEKTGWQPNYRDMDGTLLGRIAESPVFNALFSFYETPIHNLVTVFLGLMLLVPGIIALVKDIFFKKSFAN